MGRIDHNFELGATRLFVDRLLEQAAGGPLQLGAGRGQRDRRAASSTASLVTKGFDYRSNTGATMGFTSTRSSTLVLDLRAAWAQFGEFRDPSQTIRPRLAGLRAVGGRR